MRRKIYNKLLHWKNIYARKTALLIDGARRVGKSYIALEFAKRNYENYIFIDFNGIQKEIKDPASGELDIILFSVSS